MSHYFFHLWRGGQLTPDEVGVALPSLKAAEGRAVCMASSILDQNEGAPINASGWDIEVTDAAGRTCLVLAVGERSPDVKRNRAA